MQVYIAGVQGANTCGLNRFYSKTGTLSLHEEAQVPVAGDASPTEDATLNVLNQLGLYRFGCTRSCTYLALEQQKHVIAESTAPASTSGRKQYRDSGIDLAGTTDDEQQSQNFRTSGVLRNMHDSRPEFYAEASLQSPLGHRIGTYCIIDESCRTVLDNSEVKEGLEDIANAISQHLDNVHYRQTHNKGAQMMKVLSAFIEGHTDQNEVFSGEFHPSKMAKGGKKQYLPNAMPPVSLQDEQQGDKQELRRRSISTAGSVSPGTLRPKPLEKTDHIPVRNAYNVLDADLHLPQSVSDIGHGADVGDNSRRASTLVSVSDVPAISEHISTLLARARSLIKDCLNVNGVVFFDTSRMNTRRLVFSSHMYNLLLTSLK